MICQYLPSSHNCTTYVQYHLLIRKQSYYLVFCVLLHVVFTMNANDDDSASDEVDTDDDMNDDQVNVDKERVLELIVG